MTSYTKISGNIIMLLLHAGLVSLEFGLAGNTGFYFNAAQLSFGKHNGYQVSNDVLDFGCLRIVNTEVISKINLRCHQLPIPTKYATQYTLIIEVINLRNRFRQVNFKCITDKQTRLIIILIN